MKCTICKNGDTNPGFATVTLERNESVIIFKNVSAEICDNCGEFYSHEKTSAELLKKAEIAVNNGAVLFLNRIVASKGWGQSLLLFRITLLPSMMKKSCIVEQIKII